MRYSVDSFVWTSDEQTLSTLREVQEVKHTFYVEESPTSSDAVRNVAKKATAKYTLLAMKRSPLTIGYGAVGRLVQVG